MVRWTLDGGRRLSVHVPEGPVDAVVYAADGSSVAGWGPLLPPTTLLVGVHGATDETQRLHEYSPVFDASLFAAHEQLFVEGARAWVASELGVDLPPDRTAVFGASAGGELALALGLRHPDVYGAVLCGSPGAGFRPDEPLPAAPRTYLVAGTGEPFFLENAVRWATALEAAGAEVVLREREGEHGADLWRAELPLMVGWAFGG